MSKPELFGPELFGPVRYKILNEEQRAVVIAALLEWSYDKHRVLEHSKTMLVFVPWNRVRWAMWKKIEQYKATPEQSLRRGSEFNRRFDVLCSLDKKLGIT